MVPRPDFCLLSRRSLARLAGGDSFKERLGPSSRRWLADAGLPAVAAATRRRVGGARGAASGERRRAARAGGVRGVRRRDGALAGAVRRSVARDAASALRELSSER